MTSNPPPPQNDPTESGAPDLGPGPSTQPTVTVVPPESVESPKKDLPPLGPHVFGKFAFFITVVPFVFYLMGGMFSTYVENTRAHACVKQQSNYVHGILNQTEGWLKENFAAEPGGFERCWNGWNLEAIKSKVDGSIEEEVAPEELEKLLEPLLDESLEPEFELKTELRHQLVTLLKMKEFEEEHKLREVLALSNRQFEDLEGADGGDIDENKVITDSATSADWFPDDQTWYPTTYTITIAGTALLMLLAFPGYFKAPFKITIWSVIVGVVGIVVWIALVELDRNFLHVGSMLAPGGRDAFNPFEELKGNQTWMWQFIAIRFLGLCLIVPFIEEFFLRGWLMRYIDDPDWDQMPLAQHGQLAIFGVVGYAVVSHLGEPLAAAAWFGMVTWLFLKTKSIWDCVVAHAITNILLGIFVVYTGSWYLW